MKIIQETLGFLWKHSVSSSRHTANVIKGGVLVIDVLDYSLDCSHHSAVSNGNTATFHRKKGEKTSIMMIKDAVDPQARDYIDVSQVVRKNQ